MKGLIFGCVVFLTVVGCADESETPMELDCEGGACDQKLDLAQCTMSQALYTVDSAVSTFMSSENTQHCIASMTQLTVNDRSDESWWSQLTTDSFVAHAELPVAPDLAYGMQVLLEWMENGEAISGAYFGPSAWCYMEASAQDPARVVLVGMTGNGSENEDIMPEDEMVSAIYEGRARLSVYYYTPNPTCCATFDNATCGVTAGCS